MLSLRMFSSNTNTKNSIKQELLQLSRKVNRGLTETTEERARILELFEKLERTNKNKATLSDPNLSAVWELEYTTSDSILGRGKAPKVGPILQTIDTKSLKAKNEEVTKYFNFLMVPAKVTADLEPISSSEVKVLFDRFTIGPVSFNARRDTFTNFLDITYVDKDIRLSRGGKGNIFVLSRYREVQSKDLE